MKIKTPVNEFDPPPAQAGPSAFTLIELSVVLAVLAVLAAMLLPAMAKSRPLNASIECVANKKELTLSWLMYAADNNGKLPPNANGTGGVAATKPNWSYGWLDWTTASDNTNMARLTNGLLGPYNKNRTGIYKCPADAFLSGAQRHAGWQARARSVSMNGFIQGGAYGNGANGSSWYPGYAAYDKMTDIVKPSPANLFVFLDEHPDSINDGWFITSVTISNEFEDLPASYHNRGGGISFADGHAEIHKWLTPLAAQPVKYGSLNGTWPGPIALDADVAWMTKHASSLR